MKFQKTLWSKPLNTDLRACQEIIKFQEEAVAKFGKEKIVPELYEPNKDLEKEITDFASEMVKEAMWIMDKDERMQQ